MERYRKSAPVRLKLVNEDMTITTLEGEASAKAGEAYLAKGIDDELWFIDRDKVMTMYKQILPPDEDGFATFVSQRTVTAELLDHDEKRGDGLEGKAGKDYRVVDGDDVWFVKKDIFERTYEHIK